MFNIAYETESSLSPNASLCNSWHKNSEIFNLSSVTADLDHVSNDVVVQNSLQNSNTCVKEQEKIFRTKLNPLAYPFKPKLISLNNENSFSPYSTSILGDDHIQMIQSDHVFLYDGVSLLNFTPLVLNDALTPNISIMSDVQNNTTDSIVVADVSVRIPEASLMINGHEEVVSNKTILDPCAEPFYPNSQNSVSVLNACAETFFPQNRKGLQNRTQPAVVTQKSAPQKSAPQKN